MSEEDIARGKNEPRRVGNRGIGRFIARKLMLIAALFIITVFMDLLVTGFSADRSTWQFLLFIDGALWMGLGALLGGGMADSQMVASTSPVASPYTAETLTRNRLSERDKQLGTGIMMIIVGAIFLLLCFIITYLP